MQKRFLFHLLVGILMVTSVFADTGVCESTSGFLTSLPPEVPVLNIPTNEMPDVPVEVILDWFPLPHAATYTLQISTTETFNDLFVNESGLPDTTFSVTGLEKSTIYYWRVSATNAAGEGGFSSVWHFKTLTLSSVEQGKSPVPKNYALLPVYPNPFNPSTSVTYQLPESADVSVTVFNNMGQMVRELASGRHSAGRYTVQWDGRDSRGTTVTSGLYICFFKAGSQVFKQKMILMR